jgi:hypothetical protein
MTSAEPTADQPRTYRRILGLADYPAMRPVAQLFVPIDA